MANRFEEMDRPRNRFLEMDAIREFEHGRNSFGIDFSQPVEKVRAAVDKLPESQRQDALNVWAKLYVDRENKEGGLFNAIDNRVRAAARGTPIGSFLDELAAATSAAPYDETLAYQRARDAAFDQENPLQSLGLQLAGGVASFPTAPGAGAVMGGANLASRAVAGGLMGAGYGGLYGFGEGQGGLANRLGSAARGAAIGGALGGVAPVAGAAAGQAYGYAADRLAPLARELQGYTRGAIDRVAGALRDDQVTGQALRDASTRLGTEGMVLDLGPNALGHAETIAQQPGAGGAQVLRAVTERGRGAAARITRDVDDVLGPAQDTPALLRQMEQQRATDASALYGALRGGGTQPVWSDTLQELTSRPSVQRAIREIEEFAREEGQQVSNPFIPGTNGGLTLPQGIRPNFQFWDTVKRSIDEQIARDPTNRRLISTVRALRDELDRLVPGYADARQRFATQSGVINAVEEGQEAFRRGVDPNEMRAAMAERSAPEQAGYQVGARQGIRNIMGEAGDPESAARRAFRSDYARDRLGTVVGPQGAQRLANRLDAEEAFQAAENQIRANSATARRQAFAGLYPQPSRSRSGAGLENSSATGWLLRALRSVGNAAVSGGIDRRNAAIASDAARLLTASGGNRDALVAALLRRGEQLNRRAGSSRATDAYLQSLIQALRAPASNAAEQY